VNLVALQDETWQWDDSQAVESTGAQAQVEADHDLMEAAGTDNVADAVAVLMGRPRLGDKPREKSVQIHFKASESMAAFVDEQRERSGLRNKSEYLRMLIEQEMKHQNHRLQAA
jgi:hypothetical protein